MAETRCSFMVEKMYKYLKRHEEYVLKALESRGTDLAALADYHKTQIGFLQHERLIHLLVTLAVALFMIVSAGIALMPGNTCFFLIVLILLVLLLFYVVHYYHLENGVQRWYAIYDKIIGMQAERGDGYGEE